MSQKVLQEVLDPTLDAFFTEVIDTDDFRDSMGNLSMVSDTDLHRRLSAVVLYVSEGGDGTINLPINVAQLIRLFYELYAWRQGHGSLLRRQD